MQTNSPTAHHFQSSRRERFYGGYTWLIIKNLVGWTLILAALLAGPLVPGPGGIPLFLIGFTLISLPGKRKLTARILRGRRIAIGGRPVRFTVLGISLAIASISIGGLAARRGWALVLVPLYFLAFVGTGLAVFGGVLLINLLIRLTPRIRRRVRPWLRRRHIRLLPPRYRPRLSHESGIGPVRLKGEILALIRKRHLRSDRRQVDD